MTKTLDSVNASGREEMVCPECFTQGLVATEPHVSKASSESAAILEGTSCPQDDCKYNSETPGPSTIPADKIRKQYSKAGGFSLSLSSLSILNRKSAAGLVIIGAIALLFAFGGGSGVETASAGNVTANETSPSFVAVDTVDGWTIYTSEGNYMVSGKIEGDITYLNKSGELVPSPWIFNSEQKARNAILAWQARDDQIEGNPQPNKTTDDPISDSQLGIYEINGSYVVATEVNGEIRYLTKDGGLSSTPYFFRTKDIATNHYLAYIQEHGPGSSPSGDQLGSPTESGVTEDIKSWQDGGDSSQTPSADGSEDGDGNSSSPSTTEENDSEDGTTTSSDGVTSPTIPDYTGGEDTWSGSDGSTPESDSDGSDSDGSSSDGSDSDGSDSDGSDSDGSDSDGSDSDGSDSDGSDSDGSDSDGSDSDGSDSDGSDSDGSDSDGSDSDGSDSDNSSSTDNGITVPEGETSSDTVQGTYQNTDGEPVEGATIHLHSTPRTTKTDSEGEFKFENVSEGTHELYVDPTDTELNATTPVEFTLADNGQMDIVGNSDAALFIENADGSVAGNSVTLFSEPARAISVSGSGSNITANITFKQEENAKDATVTLTPIDSRVTQTKNFTGKSVSDAFEIEGSAEPENGQLILSGIPETDSRQLTGVVSNETLWPTFGGNLPPSDVSLTLDGTEIVNGKYLTGGTLSSGTLPSVDRYHSANLGPQDVKLYLAPQTRYLFDSSAKASSSLNGLTCYRSDDINACEKSKQGTFTDTTRSVRGEGTYKISYNLDVEAGSLYHGWGNPKSIHTGSGEGTVKLKKCNNDGCEVVDEASASNSQGDWDADGDRSELSEPYTTDSGSSDTYTTSLEPGTHFEVESTLSGDGTVISKVRVTRTESPDTLSISGEGLDKELAVSPADQFSPTPPGGQTMALTQRENGSLTSVSDINPSGDWTENYTITQNLGDIDSLDNISVSVDKGDVAYRAVWTSSDATQDVAVKSHDSTYCELATLKGRVTCDVPAKEIEKSPTPLEPLSIAAEDKPLDYTIDYTARIGPSTVQAEINGATYLYPRDSVKRTPLGGNITASGPLLSLQTGSNSINLETGPVEGTHPEAKATIKYLGGLAPSKKPTITVKNANGTYTKTVPASVLNRENALTEETTLDLPSEWFVEGENQIYVSTPGESDVKAIVKATGLQQQSKSAKPAAN